MTVELLTPEMISEYPDPRQIESARQILKVYSQAALGLCALGKHMDVPSRISRNGHLPDLIFSRMENVDNEVLCQIQEEHKVSPEGAKNILSTSLRNSNETVLHVLDSTLPPQYLDSAGPVNEVIFHPSSIAENIWRFADKARDPVDQFQVYRLLCIAHPFIEMNARYPEDWRKDQLYAFQDFLNAHLYDPYNPENVKIDFVSRHDDSNACVDVTDIRNWNLRSKTVSARSIPVTNFNPHLIHAVTQPNMKEPGAAGAKGIHKALLSGTGVNMPELVKDLMRLRITVLGGPEERDVVFAKLQKILQNQKEEPVVTGRFPFKVSRIVDDSRIDGRSKNGQIDMKRVKIFFIDPRTGKEVEAPIETLVNDYQVQENGEGNTGKRTGPRFPLAHRLYTHQRNRDLLPVILPKSVYPELYENERIWKAVEEKRQMIISDLIKEGQSNELRAKKQN